VIVDERSGFEARWELEHAEPDVEDVMLREGDGLLRVQLTVTPFGMPRRWRRPPAVRLAPDEWLRWQINYRFVGPSGGEWRYRQDTLNLAYGAVSPNIFTGTPTRHVDELADLR
jgi:hypothetical protein